MSQRTSPKAVTMFFLPYMDRPRSSCPSTQRLLGSFFRAASGSWVFAHSSLQRTRNSFSAEERRKVRRGTPFLAHVTDRRVGGLSLSPPGRGFRIKSTTSFQSFFRIALPPHRTKKQQRCWTSSQAAVYVTAYGMNSPANVLRGHSCSAKALHTIIVDEASLFQGCQGLIHLFICPWDVPDAKNWHDLVKHHQLTVLNKVLKIFKCKIWFCKKAKKAQDATLTINGALWVSVIMIKSGLNLV